MLARITACCEGRRTISLAAGAVLILSCQPLSRASAAAPAEIFAAEAIGTSAGFKADTRITLTIDRFTSETDRDELMASLKRGGPFASRTVLSKAFDAGMVEIGAQRLPIKYAYSETTDQGRLITVVTAQPINVTDDDRAIAIAMARREFGLIILVVPESAPGHGELIPAMNIRFGSQGAIVTDGYKGRTILLSNVVAQ